MAIAIKMHPKIERLQEAARCYCETIQSRWEMLERLESLPRKKRRKYARAMIQTAMEQEASAYQDLLWAAEACLKVKSLSGLR